MSNFLIKLSVSQSETAESSLSVNNIKYFISVSIFIKQNSLLYKEYIVEKTYSQFKNLHKIIKNRFSSTPKFPKESLFTSKQLSEKQVKERYFCLNDYIQGLLRIHDILLDIDFRKFLVIDDNLYDDVSDCNQIKIVGIESFENFPFRVTFLSTVYCDYKYNEESFGYYCLCYEGNKKDYIRIVKYCNQTKSFIKKSEDFVFDEEKIMSMSSIFNNSILTELDMKTSTTNSISDYISKCQDQVKVKENENNSNKIKILLTTKSGFVYILEFNLSCDYIKQTIKFEAHKKIKTAFFYSSLQMIITSIGMKNIKLWKCEGMKLEDKLSIPNPTCIEYDNKKKYLFISSNQYISMFLITESRIVFLNKTTINSKSLIVYMKYIKDIDNNESIFIISQGKTNEISCFNLVNHKNNFNDSLSNISFTSNVLSYIKWNSIGSDPLFVYLYKDVLYIIDNKLNILFYIRRNNQWRLILFKSIWEEEEFNDKSIFIDLLDEDRLLIYSNLYKKGFVIYIKESFVNVKYSIINNENENDEKVLGLYKSKTINDYLDVSQAISKTEIDKNEISIVRNMSMIDQEKKISLDEVYDFINQLN